MRRLREIDERHHLTPAVPRPVGDRRCMPASTMRPTGCCAWPPRAPYTFILEATREVPRRLSHPSRKTIGIRVPGPPGRAAAAACAGPAADRRRACSCPAMRCRSMTSTRSAHGCDNELELVIDAGRCGVRGHHGHRPERRPARACCASAAALSNRSAWPEPWRGRSGCCAAPCRHRGWRCYAGGAARLRASFSLPGDRRGPRRTPAGIDMFADRVLSGMRPTGAMHLGHFHGALKNWVRLQDEHPCFFFVADWHALTTHYDSPDVLEKSVWDMLIDWFAAGIDPAKATVFIQSPRARARRAVPAAGDVARRWAGSSGCRRTRTRSSACATATCRPTASSAIRCCRPPTS